MIPKLVIAEFTAPATLTDRGAQQTYVVNWSLGACQHRRPAGTPQRVSIVFDDPRIDRVGQSMQVPLAQAKHAELHGRLAEGSPADHPVIESRLLDQQGSIQGLHPLLAEPFDVGVRAMVSGLEDLSPKPWPVRFRELQAAGGHVEIVQSRHAAGRSRRGRGRHARASARVGILTANCR